MDLYKNAIVMKTKPKPVPPPTTVPVSDPKVVSTPTVPVPVSDPKVVSTPTVPPPTVPVPVPDIKLILEKERKLDDLLRQYKATEQPEDDDDQNVAVDFFMKMVKTYLALVFKFGDTVANMVIRMVLPAQLAEPIISDGPLNLGEFVKTADRVNQVLASPQFKIQLKSMIENTGQALSPPIKSLLNKVADILLDVAGKTGSKLATTTAVTLSAFPPFAPIFAIADLLSVGIKAVSSGVKLISTTANSGAKMMDAFNSVPKNIQFGGGFITRGQYKYGNDIIIPQSVEKGIIKSYIIRDDSDQKLRTFNQQQRDKKWQDENIKEEPLQKAQIKKTNMKQPPVPQNTTTLPPLPVSFNSPSFYNL